MTNLEKIIYEKVKTYEKIIYKNSGKRRRVANKNKFSKLRRIS